MSFRVETTATFTCSRCKTELAIDIPTPTDSETDFSRHCREICYRRRKEAGWGIVHLELKPAALPSEFSLCPECASGTQQFMTDIESFTSSEGTCCLFDEYCSDHGFHHGAEASELREGIEKVIKHPDAYGPSCVEGLQNLLDSVDARDSLAYAEHAKREKARDDEAGRR